MPDNGKIVRKLKNKEKIQLTNLRTFRVIGPCVIRLDMAVDGHLLITLKDIMVKWMLNMVINSHILTMNYHSDSTNISSKLEKVSNIFKKARTSIPVLGLPIGSCLYYKVLMELSLFTPQKNSPERL